MAIVMYGGVPRDFEQERLDEQRKSEILRSVCDNLRERDIARTKARHELESDEFFTADDKALAIINQQPLPTIL